MIKTNLSFDKIIEDLRNSIARVNFIKVDGSAREMYCTRNAKYIEAHTGNKEDSNVNTPYRLEQDRRSGSITVFDCEKKQFRRFKLDRVTNFEIYSNDLNVKTPEDLMSDVLEVFFKKQKQLLENFVVKIIFRKADGSTRRMLATRNVEYAKLHGVDLTNQELEMEDGKFNTMTVIDLEKGAIRRYNLTRLLGFKLQTKEGITPPTQRLIGFDGEERLVNGYSFFAIADVVGEGEIDDVIVGKLIDTVCNHENEIGYDIFRGFVANVDSSDYDRYNEDEETEVIIENNKTSGIVNKTNDEVEFEIDLGNVSNVNIRSVIVEGNKVKLVLNVK